MDRLSELPDSLLIHILSSIPDTHLILPEYAFSYILRFTRNPWFGRRKGAPVKDAAVTSVLSKRWHSLWAELPVLRFFEPDMNRITSFVGMVDRALAIRTAQNLEELYVYFWYHPTWASRVDVWLEFAYKSKAKIIYLEIPRAEGYIRDRYTLPEMLYCNSSLVELFLGHCVVAPLRRIHWKCLINLQFCRVEVEEHVLENILSGCPVLSCLGLNHCWGFHCLNINSPTLDKLEFWDLSCSLLKISAPSLRYLHICVLHIKERMQLTNISSLLKASVEYGFCSILELVRHVPELEIGQLFFKSIVSDMASGWRLPQSMLTTSLIVKVYEEMEIHVLLSLLESSPKLEKLEILSLKNDPVSPGDQSVRDDLSYDLLHLKTIKMECVANDAMLMLVRILLKRATMLDKMSIHTNIKEKEELAVTVQKVLAYPRLSKKAVVLVS